MPVYDPSSWICHTVLVIKTALPVLIWAGVSIGYAAKVPGWWYTLSCAIPNLPWSSLTITVRTTGDRSGQKYRFASIGCLLTGLSPDRWGRLYLLPTLTITAESAAHTIATHVTINDDVGFHDGSRLVHLGGGDILPALFKAQRGHRHLGNAGGMYRQPHRQYAEDVLPGYVFWRSLGNYFASDPVLF